MVHDGQLISQYPALYAFIAIPFYALIGYQGLFLLNAIAFCGSVGLCYLTANRIFEDKALSLNASLVFAFASYAWGYAQATWPHALSGLAVLAAVYLTLRSFQATAKRQSIGWAAAAGLIAGLGIGVRIDTVFVFPAIMFVLLFANPVRRAPAAAVILGAAPPLAVVAVINQAKFGIASPFSYGSVSANWSSGSPLGYLPLVALALAAAAVLWPLSRPAGRAFYAAHRWKVSGAVIVTAGAMLAVPEVRALLAQLANGLYKLVIDFRIRDLGIKEGGLFRGPGGSMIYIGGLKKTLLQSCPYIAALCIPIWALLRGRKNAFMLAALLLVPATFVGVYARFAWHGGSSLNMRYFVPILPFAAILAAYAWRDLAGRVVDSGIGIRIGAALAALLTGGWIWLRFFTALSLPQEEMLMLTLPLVIAAIVLGLSVAHLAVAGPTRITIARAAQASLLVAFAWSALVTFTYDAPRALAKRATDARVARQVRPLMAPGAVVVTDRRARFASLYASGDFRVAATNLDSFASLRPVVKWSFGAGRPVYAWFTQPTWQFLRSRGYFKSIRVKPLAIVTESIFAELLPVTPGTANRQGRPAATK